MESRLMKRAEVPEELTWRLEDVFSTAEEWEEAGKKVLREADAFREEYEGKLGDSAAALLSGFQKYEHCLMMLSRVSAFALMRNDQDTGNGIFQEMHRKAQAMGVRTAEQLSFLEPEVLSIPEDTLGRFAAEEPGLSAYAAQIKEIVRRRAHCLPAEMEKLLASAGEMAQAPYNAFGVLSGADLRFPAVKTGDGEELAVSNSRFVPLQMSQDRELRKRVFETFYGKYREFANTWAALYDGQVKQQMFYARARKYPSAFTAAVDENNVDPSVCENLIACVRKNLDKMHRYVRLRRKLLGVSELHMYDVYTPMVKDYEKKISFEEAKETVLQALRPLGEEYIRVLRKMFEERWIDAAENEGKRSGAYSCDVYGVHPYILLNFTGTLDDMFTLAHEAGHSMHSWFSSRANGYLDSQYRIFAAEVASTTNEVLLLEYLLSKPCSYTEREYLVNHYLESFKGTLYRQTMFEEFEKKTNAMAEEGIPLTADTLSEVYYELNREYFGEDMVSDDLIRYEWCRIPHFYYNFYVYQYATSFSAAVAIARRILEERNFAEDTPAVRRYLDFLSRGCTLPPVELLKIAGVDLSTEQPVEEALAVFDDTLEAMEELASRRDPAHI